MQDVAPRFAAAVRRATNDEDIQIDLADAVLPPSGARGPKPQGFKGRGAKPGHEGAAGKPKWGKKPPGQSHSADGAPAKPHRGKAHAGGPAPKKRPRGQHGSA